MKRVLIVDDAIDLGRMLQDALKVTHPEMPITVVPSAEEALLEATRFNYDLLVTDLRLPGMSGLELISKIRARRPLIKVIVITALTPGDRLFRQSEESHSQMDGFIRKPLSVAAFLEMVDSLIGAQPPGQLPVEAAQRQVEVARQAESVLTAVKSQPRETPEVEQKVIVGEALPAADILRAGEPLAFKKGEGQKSFPAEGQKLALLHEIARGQAFSCQEGIAAILDRLKAALNADAVLLVDGQGCPVAFSGAGLDQGVMEQLVPAAIASLNAGIAVSCLVETVAAGSLQAYRGAEWDLILAPAAGHFLLVWLKPGPSALRLAIAVEEVLAVQAELASCLESEGAGRGPVHEVSSPQPVPEVFGVTKSLNPEDIDASLKQLEALLGGQQSIPLLSEDPDRFWEAAAGKESRGLAQPGSLSYEQAQELGLIRPDEE